MGAVVCKASVLDWLGRATWSVMVLKASMLNWIGIHLPSIYMHCPWSSSGFSGMQGISVRLTGEGHIKCNGIQGIYAWLPGGSICLLYTCIVLDLIVGVTVCKTSVLNWLGRATWNIMVFNASMLDWLGRATWSVMVFRASVLNWVGRATWSVMEFNAYMLDWLGCPSVFYIYALS